MQDAAPALGACESDGRKGMHDALRSSAVRASPKTDRSLLAVMVIHLIQSVLEYRFVVKVCPIGRFESLFPKSFLGKPEEAGPWTLAALVHHLDSQQVSIPAERIDANLVESTVEPRVARDEAGYTDLGAHFGGELTVADQLSIMRHLLEYWPYLFL
jgi:hypothetical protein